VVLLSVVVVWPVVPLSVMVLVESEVVVVVVVVRGELQYVNTVARASKAKILFMCFDLIKFDLIKKV
jgi:hypothetical protein